MNSCLRIHPYHLAGEDCWIQMCDNQCVLMRFSKLLCGFNLNTFCVNGWRLNPVAVMLMTELLHWSLVSFFFFFPPVVWLWCLHDLSCHRVLPAFEWNIHNTVRKRIRRWCCVTMRSNDNQPGLLLAWVKFLHIQHLAPCKSMNLIF